MENSQPYKSIVVRNMLFLDQSIFYISHMGITYGDTIAPGSIKFALLVVDRKTQNNFILPLHNCKSTTNTSALQNYKQWPVNNLVCFIQTLIPS